MLGRSTRRQLLKTAGGGLLGLGGLGFLSRLPRISADEASLQPEVVPLPTEIEPIVRLLEDTPRDHLLEEVANRIAHGLSYREIVTALLLAGVRDIQPRPSVGFKFHAVLVVNPAYLSSIAGPDADRWLPIFWALDYFKDSQARDVRQGNWRMRPVNESALPPAHKARGALVAAMDAWDEAGADAAVTALARNAGSDELFEVFYRYGARDFRAIGHKAIFVAHSRRILSCIGWQFAEPVLRSLAYALLMHEGANPASRDAWADRPWRRNEALARQIPAEWQGGTPSKEATVDMLAVLRQGNDQEAAAKVVELLKRRVAPPLLWDAFFLGAGELLLRRPGFTALHAVTTTNALHFAYQSSADDLTRRLLMLQNAAFLAMFRQSMGDRQTLGDMRADTFEPQDVHASGAEAVEEILADVSFDRKIAARKTLAYLRGGGSAKALIDAARELVFLKGDDPHDYKFSAAVFEDYYHATPAWRDRYLAASMMQLRGSESFDNPLIGRIRTALEA